MYKILINITLILILINSIEIYSKPNNLKKIKRSDMILSDDDILDSLKRNNLTDLYDSLLQKFKNEDTLNTKIDSYPEYDIYDLDKNIKIPKKWKNYSCEAIAKVLIGEDGKILEKRIKSINNYKFIDIILNSISKTEFKPALKDNKPIKKWIYIPFCITPIGNPVPITDPEILKDLKDFATMEQLDQSLMNNNPIEVTIDKQNIVNKKTLINLAYGLNNSILQPLYIINEDTTDFLFLNFYTYQDTLKFETFFTNNPNLFNKIVPFLNTLEIITLNGCIPRIEIKKIILPIYFIKK
jgi:hypothetical protein